MVRSEQRLKTSDMDARSTPKLQWDYTALADAYIARPDYADSAIDRCAEVMGLAPGARVLDLGAGAGHLTIKLAERGWHVLALEPNPGMRAHGVRRTQQFPCVHWMDGVMERTGVPDASFAACTCGSSFGVVDRSATLREVARVLQDDGWFLCLFNHRVLDDPLQREIEDYIRSCIPDYSYGSRRENQSAAIASSGLFEPAMEIEAPVTHSLQVSEWLAAWRSHATLQRQAGERFPRIVEGIAAIVARTCDARVEVPYMTRAWVARALPRPARASRDG
jgi:ubiquinone/menaquinone biosynthesis C-methylase UbiE